MIKAKGKRGSWFATWQKENLPCVHEEWYNHKQGGLPFYLDPGVKLGEKQWDDFIDALKNKKRVILTRDEYTEPKNFKRSDYQGIFDIDNIAIDDAGLRFDFIKRIK